MYRLEVQQHCNLAGMKPVTASRTGIITHTIETNFIPTVGSTFSTGNVHGEVETVFSKIDYDGTWRHKILLKGVIETNVDFMEKVNAMEQSPENHVKIFSFYLHE